MGIRVKKWLVLITLLVLVAACAKKPPLQEMSEARSLIETVTQQPTNERSSRRLQQAEHALKQASSAIDEKKFGLARSKAMEAKRMAQEAARLQKH